MCKRTNKCLYAASFAFYMIIYYLSTGYENILVCNGEGNGTPLSHIHSASTLQLKPKNVFLDNDTGDIYVFNQVK